MISLNGPPTTAIRLGLTAFTGFIEWASGGNQVSSPGTPPWPFSWFWGSVSGVWWCSSVNTACVSRTFQVIKRAEQGLFDHWDSTQT
jgi:hypothetical protein